MECIELLVRKGKANINAANSWKLTPINVAMLLNHEGCVKLFLDFEGIDVNCKDEQGRTMLMLSVQKQNDRSVDFLTYLLNKEADLRIVDVDGRSALHHLAGVNLRAWHGDPRANDKEKRLRIQLEVCRLLLNRGADRTAKDNNK